MRAHLFALICLTCLTACSSLATAQAVTEVEMWVKAPA